MKRCYNGIFHFPMGKGTPPVRFTYTFDDEAIIVPEIEATILVTTKERKRDKKDELVYFGEVMDAVVKKIGGEWEFLEYEINVWM